VTSGSVLELLKARRGVSLSLADPAYLTLTFVGRVGRDRMTVEMRANGVRVGELEDLEHVRLAFGNLVLMTIEEALPSA
jgi:hypothetical protein